MDEDGIYAPPTQTFAGEPGGKPMEPGMPPPPGDDSTGTVGSTDWFMSSFGLVLCGKRMSNDKVKQVVYAGGAVIALLLVVLVYAFLSGGENSPSPPPPPASAPTTVRMEYLTYSAVFTGGKPDTQIVNIPATHECQVFSETKRWEEWRPFFHGLSPCGPSNPSAGTQTGTDEARCGITDNGELFALHRDPKEWCGGPVHGLHDLCGWGKPGPLKARGDITDSCSQVDWGYGLYVKCCWATPDASQPTCSDSPTPVMARKRANPLGCGSSSSGSTTPSSASDITLLPPGTNCCRLNGPVHQQQQIASCSCTNVSSACNISVATYPPGDSTWRNSWIDLQHDPSLGDAENYTIGRVAKISDSQWIQNSDDGWFHVSLPFNFHWFGEIENTITIGSNGLLTFGTGHLHYGGSEPVPCQHGAHCSGSHNVQLDGVIAPFWCDLHPGAANQAAGEGVFFIITANYLAVEYAVPTFGAWRDSLPSVAFPR
jgi:hypothetical protein